MQYAKSNHPIDLGTANSYSAKGIQPFLISRTTRPGSYAVALNKEWIIKIPSAL